MKVRIVSIVLLIALISSCIPQKQMKFIQDVAVGDTINKLKNDFSSVATIQPYDNLYIKVLSFDEKTYGFFNLDSKSTNTQSPEAINLMSYSVSDSGYIDFPFIGEIYLRNKTLKEAKKTIEAALKDYLEQTSVVIRFVNNDYSVLGEVRRPGKYPVIKEQINIFEALATAGDISDYGNRKRVTVVRQVNNFTTFNYLDLTDKRVVENDCYYLRPRDIVYVEPLKAKQWGFSTFPYTLILSSLTTMVSLLYFFGVKP